MHNETVRDKLYSRSLLRKWKIQWNKRVYADKILAKNPEGDFNVSKNSCREREVV